MEGSMCIHDSQDDVLELLSEDVTSTDGDIDLANAEGQLGPLNQELTHLLDRHQATWCTTCTRKLYRQSAVQQASSIAEHLARGEAEGARRGVVGADLDEGRREEVEVELFENKLCDLGGEGGDEGLGRWTGARGIGGVGVDCAEWRAGQPAAAED